MTAKAEDRGIVPVSQAAAWLAEQSGIEPGDVNILAPTAVIPSGEAEIAFVQIDTDPAGGEVYEPLQAKGKLALTKAGVNKLAHAAGVSIVCSERISPSSWSYDLEMAERTGKARPAGQVGEARHDVAFRAVATVQLPDGTWVTETGTAEFICADRRKTARSEEQYNQQFANRIGLTETKAGLRAKRALLGLVASYTPEFLGRTLAVVRRRAQSTEAGMLGILASALYGRPVTRELPESAVRVEDTTVSDDDEADKDRFVDPDTFLGDEQPDLAASIQEPATVSICDVCDTPLSVAEASESGKHADVPLCTTHLLEHLTKNRPADKQPRPTTAAVGDLCPHCGKKKLTDKDVQYSARPPDGFRALDPPGCFDCRRTARRTKVP